jgi:hypothetical protein
VDQKRQRKREPDERDRHDIVPIAPVVAPFVHCRLIESVIGPGEFDHGALPQVDPARHGKAGNLPGQQTVSVGAYRD